MGIIAIGTNERQVIRASNNEIHYIASKFEPELSNPRELMIIPSALGSEALKLEFECEATRKTDQMPTYNPAAHH